MYGDLVCRSVIDGAEERVDTAITAIGAIVTVTADNGEWIYRVTGCDYQRKVLELAWPD